MSVSSALNKAAIENTYAIGKLLAKNGYDGCNGGYSAGAMKSFADGFREEARQMGASDASMRSRYVFPILPVLEEDTITIIAAFLQRRVFV